MPSSRFSCFLFPIRSSRVSAYKREINLLVAGLDGAGKSAVVRRLRGVQCPLNTSGPTVGYSRERLVTERFQINFLEVGGSDPNILEMYEYVPGLCHGMIYVVDFSNESRRKESMNFLKSLLQEMFLKNKPVLIFGNKMESQTNLKTCNNKFSLWCKRHLNPVFENRRFPFHALAITCSKKRQINKKLKKSASSGLKWMVNVIDIEFEWLDRRADEYWMEKELEIQFEFLVQSHIERKDEQNLKLNTNSNQKILTKNTSHSNKRCIANMTNINFETSLEDGLDEIYL